jgi:hypothetical protein
MNTNGLTMEEVRTFRELLLKANNPQLEHLMSLTISEHRRRIMSVPTSVLMGDADVQM